MKCSCILKQAPVESTASAISTVAKEVTGLTVKENADATTVSQFVHELGVLNDIQVTESVLAGDKLNLAWEASSLDEEHMNEVHINFSGDKSLALQVMSIHCIIVYRYK